MSIDLIIKPSDVQRCIEDEIARADLEESDKPPPPEPPLVVILQAGGLRYEFPWHIGYGEVQWSPQSGGPFAVIHLNQIATNDGIFIEQITHGNVIKFEGIAVRVMIWELRPGERIAVRLRRAVEP